MSTSLGLIWSLMNTLQIIVLIPLINLSFPMNTVMLSVILMTVANFDIVPHAKFNSAVFDFKDANVFTEVRFQNMGFQNFNFILNSGTTFWFINGWCFFAFVTTIFARIITIEGRVKSLIMKISSLLFYGVIIRLFLECYLELAVCSFLNL